MYNRTLNEPDDKHIIIYQYKGYKHIFLSILLSPPLAKSSAILFGMALTIREIEAPTLQI